MQISSTIGLVDYLILKYIKYIEISISMTTRYVAEYVTVK